MSTFLRNLGANNTPTQLTGASIPFQTADVFAIKSFSISGYPVYNTNPIYIGLASGKAHQQIPTGVSAIRLGETASLPQSNLSDYWLLGQNGDGVFVVCR